jgi:TatD DNase family protein
VIGGLIDIGANLTSTAFRDDLPAVLARAEAAGVEAIVVTGTDLGDSAGAAALARAHPQLYATAGVHPHHAKDVASDAGTDGGTAAKPAWIEALRALADQPRVVAIGECGLDFDRNFSPRAAQLRCFEAQLALAAELALPVFLHERAAHADFVAVVRNHRRGLGAAVVHCFTGTGPELDAYLGLDLHIGITGWICDERRGLHLRALVPRIPGPRLMLETDAPYLLPRTLRAAQKKGRDARRNEPSFLPAVLATLAESRNEAPEQTAQITTATARTFFRLP